MKIKLIENNEYEIYEYSSRDDTKVYRVHYKSDECFKNKNFRSFITKDFNKVKHLID